MHRIEENLMKVAAFAAKAHKGQMSRLNNEPYVEHPVRVMYTCLNYGIGTVNLSGALLHDVLEHTKTTEDDLLTFLRGVFSLKEASEILDIVLQLTNVYVENDYPYWNQRIRKEAELERLRLISPNAQTIKYADILDNAVTIANENTAHAKLKLSEYQQQLEALIEGDESLRNFALNQVREIILKVSKSVN